MINPMPSRIIKGQGFYVSYNQADSSANGVPTTALVDESMTTFYILNGDHQSQYQALVDQGYESCLEYFQANIDKINKLSSPLKTPGFKNICSFK